MFYVPWHLFGFVCMISLDIKSLVLGPRMQRRGPILFLDVYCENLTQKRQMVTGYGWLVLQVERGKQLRGFTEAEQLRT